MIPIMFDLGIAVRVFALVAATSLVGCGNNFSRLSDDDLRKEIHACDYAVDQNTTDKLICDNYHTECKRRLRDEGRFVCN